MANDAARIMDTMTTRNMSNANARLFAQHLRFKQYRAKCIEEADAMIYVQAVILCVRTHLHIRRTARR